MGVEKVSKTFDRYAGIIFFIIGALFIIESRKISASSYGSNVGPDIFPIGSRHCINSIKHTTFI